MNETLSYYFRNERATYVCEHEKWNTLKIYIRIN